MIIRYRNIDLDIHLGDHELIYNINTDLDIDPLRDSFNDSIGRLSLKNNSLAYWLMDVSERHTLTNDLFLDICRIKMIESLVEKHKDVKLFTNNISLYIHFKEKTEVSFADSIRFTIKAFYRQVKPYLKLIRFIVRTLIFRVRHAKRSRAKDLTNAIIIQTYVSADGFKNDEFNDTYYGTLAEFIKERSGRNVVTWPIFYMRPWSANLGNDFYQPKFLLSALSHIRKNNDDFIVAEDYLRLRDYFDAYRLFFVARFSDLGELEIDGTDFKLILDHYLKIEIIDSGSLFYFFAKRLGQRGCSNISFLINHENTKQQKSLIYGVREYLRGSKIIGNFHTSKPENLLSLDFANIDEYRIAPRPDLVIFNSPKFLKIFKDRYLDTPAINGMAFQQEYMRENFQLLNNSSEEQRDTLLVLFSGTSDEIELMFSLLKGVPEEYSLLLRMHPLRKFDPKTYLSGNSFEIVDNVRLIEVLRKKPKVLSTYSSMALECAVMGMSVGLIYNRKRLLLNPFDFTSIEKYSLIYNNDQMLEFISKPDLECNIQPDDIFNIDEDYYDIYLSSLLD